MTHGPLLRLHQSAKHFGRTQNELLITVFLHSVAESFVVIYVPIFLYTHGVGLRGIMAYAILTFASLFAVMTVALKACQFVGVKKILMVGALLTALSYWALHSLPPAQRWSCARS